MAHRKEIQNQSQRSNDQDKPDSSTASTADCNCLTVKRTVKEKKGNMEESPELPNFKSIIKSGKDDDIAKYLNKQITENPDEFERLNNAVKREYQGKTILHIALKFDNTTDFVQKILKRNRKYLGEQRLQSDNFKGQTLLHVATAKENLKAVEMILETASKKEIKKLFCTSAVGQKFKNTVLMGQLPLSVAALVCKKGDYGIISLLLKKEAKIWNKNEDGDTVFHSLIRYADAHPEKIEHIKSTFKFLWRKFLKRCKDEHAPAKTDIFFWENNDGFTPLHLSAKLGVGELFNYIVDDSEVYRFTNTRDGLFDIREYDVTEFDRLINYQEEGRNQWSLTILESLFDSKCTHNEAFQIPSQELVQFILHRKWLAYRVILLIWMVVHLSFMLVFTVSMMEKSRLLFCNHNNDEIMQTNDSISQINESTSTNMEAKSCYIGEEFYAVLVMNLIIGISYFIFAISCVLKMIGRCTSRFGNPSNIGLMLHNMDYIICLSITAIGALTECFYIFFEMHSDFHVVLVMISGWYFMLYFSPFSKNLVSFTYMIKSGFVEDFIPFATVFLWLLFSFTSIMYMLYRGTDNVDEFDTFQDSLLTMFNLGVGLNNIDVLNQSRIPWLAYTIFVVYAILSFIHLFNALIAVMTITFSNVHENRKSYLKYNKLRMIELFEDIVLVKGLANCLPFLKEATHWARNEVVKPSSTVFKQKVGNNNSNDNKGKKGNKGKIGNKGKKGENKPVEDRKRYFSILHLMDDIDKEEKNMEAKYSFKTLSKYIYKCIQNREMKPEGQNKINPENEVTFVQIQQSNNNEIPQKRNASSINF